MPLGRVELVDIQPEMLAKAKTNLDSAGLNNVGYTVASGSAPLPFPDASIDVAVLVAVLGELPDPHVALEALARVVKPSGILAIHEHVPDPDLITLGRLRRLVEAHSFALQSLTGRWWNYTAIFGREPFPVPRTL